MTTGTHVIRWGRHYELGIETVDRQHEELTDLLNSLYKQWQDEDPRSVLEATLDRLARAFRKHFRTEEQLMAKHRYLRLGSHKAEHDAFAAEIAALQEGCQKGERSLDEEQFRNLANWLRTHLVVSDKPMSEALATTQEDH